MQQVVGDKPHETGFFSGHPRALLFILICQSGFGFSIAGMQSISVLYTSAYVFQPDRIGHIFGFGPVRTMLVQIAGSDTPVALASVNFGLAAACGYLTPLICGLVSDRVMTRSQAVILGAVLCAVGQVLVGLTATFLIGLVTLLVGIGFVGVNIQTQLGDLYVDERAELADAFQYVNIVGNIAAIFGPLVCGALAEGIAWRWGFVAAAAAMSLGVVGYICGLHTFPKEPLKLATGHGSRPTLTRGDGKVVFVLLCLLPALLLAGLANGQINNAYLVWGSSTYQLWAFGHSIPASWLVALDSGFSVATGFAVITFWRLWARNRALPNDVTRIAVGTFIAAAAPLVLALASAQQTATGERVSLGWALAFHAVDSVGIAAWSPVAMALFARMAPRAVAALMMGVLNADLFGGALAVGVLGSLLGRMTNTRFWLLHAGLVAAGGVIIMLVRLAAGSMFDDKRQSRTSDDLYPARGQQHGQNEQVSTPS